MKEASVRSKKNLSFEVMGVSDGTLQALKSDNKKCNMFPEGQEKEDFLKFVEDLKND